jgi:hypothetical protein
MKQSLLEHKSRSSSATLLLLQQLCRILALSVQDGGVLQAKSESAADYSHIITQFLYQR